MSNLCIDHCPPDEQEVLRKKLLPPVAIPLLSKHLYHANAKHYIKLFAFLAKGTEDAEALITEQENQKAETFGMSGMIYYAGWFCRHPDSISPSVLKDAEQLLVAIAPRYLDQYDQAHDLFSNEQAFATFSFVVSILSESVLYMQRTSAELQAFFKRLFATETILPILLNFCAFSLFSRFKKRYSRLEHLDGTPLIPEEEAQVKQHDNAILVLIAFIKTALYYKRPEVLLQREIADFLSSLLNSKDRSVWFRRYEDIGEGQAMLRSLIDLCREHVERQSVDRKSVLAFFIPFVQNAPRYDVILLETASLALKIADLEKNFEIAIEFLSLLDPVNIWNQHKRHLQNSSNEWIY